MIDNNTQWALWIVGWAFLSFGAYKLGGEPAGYIALGSGFLRASGVPGESPFSTLLSAVLTFLKPGVIKP